MSDPAGGLSDALRNMAEGEHDDEAHDEAVDAEEVLEEGAYLEDEAGDVVASAPQHHDEQVADEHDVATLAATGGSGGQRGGSAAARKRQSQARQRSNVSLKANVIPVLFTMGILMLLIGTWALMVVLGMEDVPLADRPNATGTAMVMLACIPVGLSLLAGGVLFFQQVRAAKKK